MARASLPLVTALAVALALSAGAADPSLPEALANTGTKRIDFASREWLDIELNVNGVQVDRVKLHQAGKLKGLFTKHDEANRGVIVVTNRTDLKVNPAVAIAVLDEEGRLLAAANTGARFRSLDSGETGEFDIHFGGVFRHLERGRFLLVSLEY